ncbi:hypothetical protein COV13_04435 [Candidatus Woesearchaeota archaeon CG10_big_fil_rev_8_21_14_0_10_32_9]|nr:MAG: hypothetical protein COV13_04435 [Candidatus Woesearchaeota archaeon CG10_big_fil_rev_8_21_14_0_10_32_9]
MFIHNENIETYKDAWKNNNIWEKLLESNSGLFLKYPKNPRVVGPTLCQSGTVSGDLLAIETNYFMSVANELQKDYYFLLLEENISKAYEYILTIIDARKKWEEDIQILWDIKMYLELKANDIKMSEKKLLESFDMEKAEDIPAILKEHMPKHFVNIDIPPKDYENLIDKLEHSVKILREKRTILIEYLTKRRNEMPFLFENMKRV